MAERKCKHSAHCSLDNSCRPCTYCGSKPYMINPECEYDLECEATQGGLLVDLTDQPDKALGVEP